MPVIQVVKNSVLTAVYQIGLNEEGAPKLRKKSFSNIRATASDQDVYDVAQQLFSLQDYPLVSIRRDNCFELTE